MRVLAPFLLLVLFAAVACAPTIETLDATKFQEVIQDRDVFVLDVHTPEQEHIVGTDAFIAYDQLEQNAQLLPQEKDTPIAVYCRSGEMSAQAAQTLQQMGYTKVYDLAGGTNAWREANLQLQKGQFGAFGTHATEMTVYKSETCGCCGIWTQYADDAYDTTVKTMMDLDPIKRKLGIPPMLESCHTAVLDGYFIEGHIPLEAIDRLLAERPDIAGIAMPGMPSGSPGMPGAKTGPFVIYAVHHDGTYEEWMRI